MYIDILLNKNIKNSILNDSIVINLTYSVTVSNNLKKEEEVSFVFILVL